MQSEFRSSCSRFNLTEQPTDLHFSPVGSSLAVGYITGALHILSFSVVQDVSEEAEEEELQTVIPVVKPVRDFKLEEMLNCKGQSSASLRAVLHNEDGTHLSAAYSNGALCLYDSATGNRLRKTKRAHDCEIYRIEFLDLNTLVSGDDNGLIRVWDMRRRDSIGEIKAHLDYVTDIVSLHDAGEVVVSSGDTSITINDIRMLKTRLQSHDGFGEEGTSLQPLSNGRKLACGTSCGKIALFSTNSIDKGHIWFSGEPVHSGSVDCMVTLDEKTIVTGGADGILRASRFKPNRRLGIIGRHKVPDTIERLTISSNTTILASTGLLGLEDCVRLWDVENLETVGERKESERSEKRGQPVMTKKEKKRLKQQQQIPNFFSDLKPCTKS